MFPVHPPCRLLLSILALMACAGQALCQSPGIEHPSQKKDVSKLIDKLQEVAEGDVGYSTGMSGSGFLPLGESQFSAGILGQMGTTSSGTMRELVEQGAAAVPDLIAHLDDKRPSRITISDGNAVMNMYFSDEYDYNRLTTKPLPTGVNRGMERSGNPPFRHTVTVGDLCFVAFGQIVNRDFNAVRFQPSDCIMINSPSDSEPLRAAIKKEWGALTPEQHKASLVQDFLRPDFESRRIGACLRLGYYYPETLTPLVLKQLSAPTYDGFAVNSLVGYQLYRVGGAKKRKALFDAYVAKHGEVARQGILEYLFVDLRTQEEEETGWRSPSKTPYRARECLMQLFSYPKSVKIQDDPHLLPVTNGEQTRFIYKLERFPFLQINPAIRSVMQSTEDDYLTTTCVNYLISRGENADADIRQYVDQHRHRANAQRRAELSALQDRLGWTLLHLAAERGQIDRAKQLIQQGMDVNVRASNGQTPLHVAAAHRTPDLIRTLLAWKANPNLKDSRGKTPIQLAAFFGDESTVRALIAGGAEPADVLAASYAGRADLVEAFLEKDPGSINRKTKEGKTALFLAADSGNIEIVRVLIAHGADVNARTPRNFTPLQYAAASSHAEVVQALLENHADRHVKNVNGETALKYAMERKDDETIRLLSEE